MVHIIQKAIIFGLLLIALTIAVPLEKPQSEDDVGEYGDHFEGDMILTEEQIEDLYSPARNGIIDTKYRWPNKTVPYRLSRKHSKQQRDYIELALRKMESVSCLKFVRQTNQENYVEITAHHGGCYSSVGYRGRVQTLNLQKNKIEHGCFRLGTIIHEFLHALGFHHMQCAYDRDDYVKIHYENMKQGKEHNFRKYSHSVVTHFNTTYDYDSILHYSAYGFSKNGKPTIVPRDSSKIDEIGQRIKMSKKDVYKLNAMYECDGYTSLN